MSSEEPLCELLLRGEEEGESRREVGCQWENPEEETRKEETREVGCQSDSAERRDAAVQVDLLTQQLGWKHTGSSEVLLQCFAVRSDGPDGGALLQHCTNRTRTRTIKPPRRRSPPPLKRRAAPQRRTPKQSPVQRRRRQGVGCY
ncbi:hypothetical protein PBY51_013875 [Eleginops maclovinus]|uniref:Uncharacterized protein n=1 Tax=Eleginops maclovinus TaxID=56733 RepID=A0AAN8ABV6_ELEMC|nr:hypothetical protein PBY51_013875 [Eleginops maclovinus]